MALTQKQSKTLVRGVGGVILFILIVWTLAPLYWMLVTSLKNNTEIYSADSTFWPVNPTLDNYRTLFQKTNFLSFISNQNFGI